MRPILVSTCLLGIPTRYDGESKRNERVLAYLRENDLRPVPVCPEQLAGLPTPRPKTWFARGAGADVLDGCGKVINEHGEDVSEPFCRGARCSLAIARLTGCERALLKQRSPSCGASQIYLEQRRVAGQGITAALLQRAGIEVLGEDDI